MPLLAGRFDKSDAQFVETGVSRNLAFEAAAVDDPPVARVGAGDGISFPAAGNRTDGFEDRTRRKSGDYSRHELPIRERRDEESRCSNSTLPYRWRGFE